MRRSGFLLTAILSSVAMVAIACGGDDNNGDDTGGNDASTTDTSTADTAAPPTAKTGDLDIYAGQLASLDASGSTAGATFTWTLTTAPAGSKVTTASIANATSAKPSFTTDVVGDYVLTVAVTANGSTANATATVHAHPDKLMYAHTTAQGDGGAATEVDVIHSDGTGQAAVSCSTFYIEVPGAGALPAFGINRLLSSMDWFEGAPTDSAKIAYGFRELQDDGGFTNYLDIGNEASRCNAGDQKFDVFTNGGDVPRALRISPNGDRVAYMRWDGITGLTVVTLGLDGSNRHSLGPAFTDGTNDSGTPLTPRFQANGTYRSVPVQWVDETHLSWVVEYDTNNWAILTAEDIASPQLVTTMTCASIQDPNATMQPLVLEANVLTDGTLLVLTQPTTVDAGASLQLNRLRPNASTKECELVNTIGTNITDFALSPDKTRIAFSDGNQLFLGPADGSSAPTPFTMGDGGLAASNAHWLANGASLSAAGLFAVTDGGSADNVIVVPVAGGSVDTVAAGSNQELFVAGVNVGTCSIGFGQASPFAAFGAFGSFLALALRRRRKNQKHDDT